ncbi:PrsW family intramembrane metalloprotease, partial [Candidatus Peregrinibacteria bacterium]|nr:PrsW family intramembrane metalloprotease [Candidatus Peregrinibacteria bacterium]
TFWLTSLDGSMGKSLVVALAVAIVACIDIVSRARHRSVHFLFACTLGAVLAMGAIALTRTLFEPSAMQNATLMAFAILLLIAGWRLLFGVWEARTKAVVLGTFVFWIALHVLGAETPTQRLAHLIAIGVALIPAVAWCLLFLPYHRERLSRVLVMFFAGMLATLPVLLYDALVHHGTEFQFFYFRIVPESFNSSTQSLVLGQLPGAPTAQSTLLFLSLSFLLVALVEEGCKFWVLRRGGDRFFSSIDDVIEFAIIVAIGFAFAENVTNSGYFLSFVQQYLLAPPHPQWGEFFGNVVGRSILTSMVHIVSTGTAGYFLGRAIFAQQELQEDAARGKSHALLLTVSEAFGCEPKTLAQLLLVVGGLSLAIALHAFNNLLVTLPDALPGSPQTFGALFHLSPGFPFANLSLVILPSLLYVVGGFWMLTWLFEWRENRRERGMRVTVETFVAAQESL